MKGFGSGAVNGKLFLGSTISKNLSTSKASSGCTTDIIWKSQDPMMNCERLTEENERKINKSFQ